MLYNRTGLTEPPPINTIKIHIQSSLIIVLSVKISLL